MPKISPLIIFALNSLPTKDRIARLAYLCRSRRLGNTFGRTLRVSEAKELIRATGEPWGSRGESAEALRREYAHQCVLATKRRQARRPRHACQVADYSPEIAQFNEWSQEDRKEALALSRFVTAAKRAGKQKRDIIPVHHHWKWASVPPHNIRNARVGRRSAFLVMEPTSIYTGYSLLYEHKIRYLLYTTASAVGAIRISHKCRTVDEALDYLKPATVKKASEKGYEIVADWDNLVWRIKAPRRKKWREVRFKQCERARK